MHLYPEAFLIENVNRSPPHVRYTYLRVDLLPVGAGLCRERGACVAAGVVHVHRDVTHLTHVYRQTAGDRTPAHETMTGRLGGHTDVVCSSEIDRLLDITLKIIMRVIKLFGCYCREVQSTK